MKKSPELLLPAGGLEKMLYAFAYGADAVYAGHALSAAWKNQFPGRTMTTSLLKGS